MHEMATVKGTRGQEARNFYLIHTLRQLDG